MKETMSLDAFLAQHAVTMTVRRVPKNPHMADSGNMDHWRCELRSGRDRMTVYFSQGYGHHGKEPMLADVLDCLAQDAAGYDNTRTHEEWCAEYGLDPDSRKAEKTWLTIGAQRADLMRLLGPSAYAALLYEVERL